MALEYRLLRSKRRTVALIVQKDGSLLVRAPMRLPEAQIRAFVESKADWVKEKQDLVKAVQKKNPVPHRYEEGEKFLFLGKHYPLKIVDRNRPALALEDGGFTLASSALPQAPEVFELWYRRQAAKTLSERVSAYVVFFEPFGYKPSRIRISSARTRWGSCSSTGTLSFTYRLVMAPLPIIDYVVVHELAHLRFKNHSKEFWDFVKVFIKDYTKRRAWLKENGGTLDFA